MDPRTLKYVSEACRGELTGDPEFLVQRICTDSRLVQPGDLFVALKGDQFDAHDFLNDVAAKGAALLIQAQKPAPSEASQVIRVTDTRQALGQLAARYRQDFSIPLIAIAGSNGKTTTKEIVAAVLRRKFNVFCNDASFNNDIGVPLTLLKLSKEHQFGILEAGTNHPGELQPLLRMIAPQWGIITSIGREHLEFFGDLAGVAHEEGTLAEVLPSNGKLFMNGDHEWVAPIAARSAAPVVKAGFGGQNAWRSTRVRMDSKGIYFTVNGPRPEYEGEYRLALLGQHQAGNALFAIALASELGLPKSEIQLAFQDIKPPKMRLQIRELQDVRILEDVYNSNLDSALAALMTLRDLPCKGRRIAVLGDMAELGPHSQAAHEELGRRAAESGVGQLFAAGKWASAIAAGAKAAGLSRVLEIAEVGTAAAAVKSFLKSGDLVLIKASRSARFERIIELLRSAEGGKKN
jgi:UDP-N-acetylmuramoyl-tripeptide--D-alanyl-D-alanine ligase